MKLRITSPAGVLVEVTGWQMLLLLGERGAVPPLPAPGTRLTMEALLTGPGKPGRLIETFTVPEDCADAT